MYKGFAVLWSPYAVIVNEGECDLADKAVRLDGAALANSGTRDAEPGAAIRFIITIPSSNVWCLLVVMLLMNAHSVLILPLNPVL